MLKGFLALLMGLLSALAFGVIAGIAVGLLVLLAPLTFILQLRPRRAPKPR